jgi:hypothetical protein
MVKRIFDLKGSRVQRYTKKLEKADNLTALKDLDFLMITKLEEQLIDFTDDNILHLESILHNDTSLLSELQLMDYSLLLIIINIPDADSTDFKYIENILRDSCYRQRIFKSKNSNYLYCIGIIDYLQEFDITKFFENKYKSLVYGNQSKYISAVDPMIYCSRLVDFCSECVFISNHV